MKRPAFAARAGFQSICERDVATREEIAANAPDFNAYPTSMQRRFGG